VTSEHDQNQDVPETPTVRDRRRVDPQTGQLREPNQPVPESPEQPTAAASGAPAGDAAAGTDAGEAAEDPVQAELTAAKAEAEERLADLRRVQAEYVNYKRRVDRDRESVKETARADAVAGFLPILDDIDRARTHGDLTGGFKSVGEAVEAETQRLGLEPFGAPGDAFDPTIHEAFMHDYADDVDGSTCREILQRGYRIGERVLRPARVVVVEPSVETPEEAADLLSAEQSGTQVADSDEHGHQ